MRGIIYDAKGSIQQEEIAILNVWVHKIMGKYIKETNRLGRINNITKSTIIVEAFLTPLSTVDRLTRQIYKRMKNTNNQKDIYRIF